ncbi:MAG: hypothetical protein R3310_11390, partial [Candidatus Competibacteraceae bacterium]|nr:hypothetical protein [Candidatus Competibacteraceae bacterium]
MNNKYLSVAIAVLCLLFLTVPIAQAQQVEGDIPAGAVIEAEDRAPTVAEIQALLQTLEDPQARRELLEQLRLLSQAGETVGVVAPAEPAADPPEAVPVDEAAATTEPAEPAAPPEPTPATGLVADTQIQTATSELLQAISRRLESFGDTALLFMDDLSELPQLWDWVVLQATNPLSHRLWLDVLTNLALVLGLGYGAFLVMLLLLRRPHRALAQRPGRSLLARAMLLVVLLILDLLPIAAFALVAYLTLGLIDPRELTRLVALAWINAAIIVRLVLALERMIFAPHAPALRLLDISDESAHYADIWTRRLTFTTVYGYFALQAAWLLGLPGTAYQAMLRLLGFAIMVLVIVLIVQNRTQVARLIRGHYEEGQWTPFKVVRNRLSQIWFLPAILYVLVLYAIWALAITGGFLFLLRATLVTLLILALAFLVLRVLAQLFGRGFHISVELKQRFPGLEARANRYIPTLHTLCRWLVNIIALLAIL